MIVFTIVFGISSATTFYKLYSNILVPGSNTTGEAAKVFYAHRFQTGQSIFLKGNEPPYYPAFHGALLHSSVGYIGKVFDLSIHQLFGVGRAISFICTILSIMLGALILKELNVGQNWLWIALIVFLAPYPIHEHASSYRPDNWILFLSLLLCFLRLKFPKSRLVFIMLICIPTLAFFIKATGIIGLGAIVASFWIERRWKTGVIYGISACVVLGLSIIVLQILSHGSFLVAFGSGMKVSFSPLYILQSFNLPQMWLPLILPLFLLNLFSPLRNDMHRKLSVVFSFWSITLFGAFLFALRTGSASYYFLESYAFGTILFIYWGMSAFKSNSLLKPHYLPAYGWVFTLLIMLNFSPLIKSFLPQVKNIAIIKTERFGGERERIAQWINANGWQCYSDDPGLNILLKKPMVIYPLMQSFLIKSNALNLDSLLSPVARQEHDIIVLTGIPWSYMGTQHLPQSFLVAIKKYYNVVKLDVKSKYTIMIPKSMKDGLYKNDRTDSTN